jgi:xenotropic and polytropic retrovirus receptor 1
VPFILVSICSTSYAYYWDMKHDWGFLQPDSKYPFLRSQLSYRNPRFYYSIVLLNLVLRCAWTLTITNVGAYINSDLLVFFVSLLEILRRCLWNFFRV